MGDQHASISLPDVSCPSDSVQISIAYPKTLDVGRRVCSSVAAHVSCWLGRSVELVSGLISIVRLTLPHRMSHMDTVYFIRCTVSIILYEPFYIMLQKGPWLLSGCSLHYSCM